MKKSYLIMATLLLCGLSVFTACSDEQDNPAPAPSEERAVFEKQFSQDLQAMADEFRFDAAQETTASLKEFIDVLDENALLEKVLNILGNVAQGFQQVQMDDLSDQDKAAVIVGLKSRFDMTDEEVNATTTVNIVDAYNSLAKMKMEFKDGQCNVTNDADAFTIVSTNANGETKTVALSFNDERDGVCFFATRIAGVLPLAIQLPKSIGITMTTPKGEIVTGTVNLTTADANQSKFISFKESGWVADGKLTGEVADNLQWTLSGNAADGYTFHPNGNTSRWLFVGTTAGSSDNENLRVGTGGRKAFAMSGDYLATKDSYAPRYVCVYSGLEWRGYIEQAVIPTAISFYKRVDEGDEDGIGSAFPSREGRGTAYNLAGQRADDSRLRHGVYIVGGRKMMLK